VKVTCKKAHRMCSTRSTWSRKYPSITHEK